ncbi:MAG: hypothetical protein NWP80_02165 [Candidatus Gracilibacteria bacterium]|nr:hypothetical protein [Candidatus Gracilibacteria bacterium]
MKTNLDENIIQKSWDLVQSDSKIKNFYFFPGVISIIFLTYILVYQVLYTYVTLFNQEDKALQVFLDVIHSNYITEIVIGSVIFLIIYIFMMPIFEGTLISYISKKSDDEYVSISESFGNGIYKFFPLFEYSNIFSQFKFITLLNAYLFCFRFIGLEYVSILNYSFLFLLIISTIINIMFVYSKYEILLKNKKALEAITESTKISILTIASTTKLYFFMFLLNLRVIINFLVFLIFPLLIIFALSYITTKIFMIITIIFLSIIFLILIIFLGYLGGVLDVFKTSIWYHAYIEGKKRIKEVEN